MNLANIINYFCLESLKMNAFSNIISRSFGKFASFEFPASIQAAINQIYVSIMNVDLSDFSPAYKYKSLNALFTRSLQKPRNIAKSDFISPCDCLAKEVGKTKDGLYQIKGISYSLDELLTKISQETKEVIKNGSWINLYLSPKDYHRYHIPCDLKVQRVIYVPAKLYPVNSLALKFIKDLYIKNERIIIEAIAKDKKLIIVLIGALNVGKMIVNFCPDLNTNSKQDEVQAFNFEDLALKKGEEFGYFKMGSTVLLFSEKYEFKAKAGKKLKFGEEI